MSRESNVLLTDISITQRRIADTVYVYEMSSPSQRIHLVFLRKRMVMKTANSNFDNHLCLLVYKN